MFSNVMPPAARESDAPDAPVSAKSFAELNFSPSTDDGAATCAVVPAVANVSIVVPFARSGTTSPSQFAAVANELSAPPLSQTALADSGRNRPDQASASAAAKLATGSPGSNVAAAWLVQNVP